MSQPLLPLLALALGTLVPTSLAQTAVPRPPALPAGNLALEPLVAFAGPPGGFGEIEVFDAATGARLLAPGRLTALQLLRIDHTGRTQLERYMPGRARLHEDFSRGVTRLELPFERGSLYRYRRSVHGTMRYGFLVVEPRSFPRILFELDELAPSGTDPFLATVGVAPDGTSFLAATVPAAGGDVYEVFLSRRAELRTEGVPPQAFSSDALWLARDFGFAIAPGGIWRFSRAPGATASPVPAAGVAHWTGQAVMSPARTRALATSGLDPLQRSAFVFGATGPAVRADAAPAEIADAGFLPAYTSGPWMAVTDDGTQAAWVESTPLVRDVRLSEVGAVAPGPVITGDPYLLDTLDEVGRMIYFKPFELLYAAGEQNDPAEGGLSSAEFFSGELLAGAVPRLRNLSMTSGDPSVPFTGGVPELTPDVLHLLPGERLLMHDDDDESIRWLDMTNGVLHTIEDDVKDLDWLVPAGDWYLGAIRRRSGQRPHQVLRLGVGAQSSSVVLDPGSPDHRFHAPTPAGASIAWIQSLGGIETLERADPAALTVATWSTLPADFARPLVGRADGSVAFARVAAGGGVESRVWRASGGDVLVMHPPRPGHWMP